MPYSANKPPKDLKKKIKKRHPKATKNEIKQFIHVWNSVYEKTNSEAAAFSQAWGVLNKNKKLKSSHRKTDPEQTKRDVKKYNKKHSIKPPKKKKKKSKKKAFLISELVKLANDFDNQGYHDLTESLDSVIESLSLEVERVD